MTNYTPVILDGKVIGQVNADGIYQKRVKFRHILRNPRAIAYDLKTLEQVKKAGADSLLVICEDGTRYSADLATFDCNSFPVNRGWGKQRALKLGYWQRTKPGEPVARQLALQL